MQVWKRRLVALVAVGVGSAGLMMSTASAQVPPDFPPFPSIPDFTFPTFTIPTIPPPTMPPSTSVTTTPPPTMPPSTTVTTSPPPTMPPTSFPSTSIPIVPSPTDLLDEFFEDLIDRFEEGGETFDELRSILDDIIASF